MRTAVRAIAIVGRPGAQVLHPYGGVHPVTVHTWTVTAMASPANLTGDRSAVFRASADRKHRYDQKGVPPSGSYSRKARLILNGIGDSAYAT